MDRTRRRGLPEHRSPARPERVRAGGRRRHGKKNGSELIDLTSYGCPLHYIKARNELRRHQAGDVVEFLFNASDSAARQASNSLESEGHEILAIADQNGAVRVRVRKTGS